MRGFERLLDAEFSGWTQILNKLNSIALNMYPSADVKNVYVLVQDNTLVESPALETSDVDPKTYKLSLTMKPLMIFNLEGIPSIHPEYTPLKTESETHPQEKFFK
ncbi:MAG: hypothetical protein CMI52_04450 [Parcubacteria group bacterium]|nr:hypothetical protein [Parcubacteria group bacterium]|tara:strand:+ start:2112 stop:2426 length:315 start_codon:yes stop_codon:yes gene_type:complete